MNLLCGSMICCVMSTRFMLSAVVPCVSSRWENLPTVAKVCEFIRSQVSTAYCAGNIHGTVHPCIHSQNKLIYPDGQINYTYVSSTYIGSFFTSVLYVWTNCMDQLWFAPCGAWAPLFSLVHLLPHLFPLLLFFFFHWFYLFSSFVHPFPFYQNSPTPFPDRRS